MNLIDAGQSQLTEKIHFTNCLIELIKQCKQSVQGTTGSKVAIERLYVCLKKLKDARLVSSENRIYFNLFLFNSSNANVRMSEVLLHNILVLRVQLYLSH